MRTPTCMVRFTRTLSLLSPSVTMLSGNRSFMSAVFGTCPVQSKTSDAPSSTPVVVRAIRGAPGFVADLIDDRSRRVFSRTRTPSATRAACAKTFGQRNIFRTVRKLRTFSPQLRVKPRKELCSRVKECNFGSRMPTLNIRSELYNHSDERLLYKNTGRDSRIPRAPPPTTRTLSARAILSWPACIHAIASFFVPFRTCGASRFSSATSASLTPSAGLVQRLIGAGSLDPSAKMA
jgi:hypothetical protein